MDSSLQVKENDATGTTTTSPPSSSSHRTIASNNSRVLFIWLIFLSSIVIQYNFSLRLSNIYYLGQQYPDLGHFGSPAETPLVPQLRTRHRPISSFPATTTLSSISKRNTTRMPNNPDMAPRLHEKQTAEARHGRNATSTTTTTHGDAAAGFPIEDNSLNGLHERNTNISMKTMASILHAEDHSEDQWMPPYTAGAYIHIGKCGGSTMTSQLVNGCHSWVPKPCTTTVRNETIISRSTTYYHVPDFPRADIKNLSYSFYVVQIRDPLARFRSIFGSYHLDNAPFREQKDKYVIGKAKRKRQVHFSKCFPSLEDFALASGERKSTWKPTHLDKGSTRKCSRIPKEIFSYQNIYSEHWHWNHDTVYRQALLANPHFSNATVLALRTENLWGDWISANQFLGQDEVYVPPNPAHVRGYGHLELPASKHLSERGQRNLCKALIPEYQAYFALLRLASNIDEKQKLESLKISQSNCPWLGLTMDY